MKTSQEGFTLLEVLVALTILAVAAAGLMSAWGQNARQLARLEEKTFAHWVAANRLAELRTQKDYRPGATEEKVSLAGREWTLRMAVSQSAQGGVRKAEVIVMPAGDNAPAASMVGFLGE